MFSWKTSRNEIIAATYIFWDVLVLIQEMKLLGGCISHYDFCQFLHLFHLLVLVENVRFWRYSNWDVFVVEIICGMGFSLWQTPLNPVIIFWAIIYFPVLRMLFISIVKIWMILKILKICDWISPFCIIVNLLSPFFWSLAWASS